jgi:hypothetical protein
LRSAATNGVKAAQLEYAYLLESSDPPTKNLVEAWAWADLHAGGSDTEAKFAKDIQSRTERAFTEPDRSQAKERAKQIRELVASKQ